MVRLRRRRRGNLNSNGAKATLWSTWDSDSMLGAVVCNGDN